VDWLNAQFGVIQLIMLTIVVLGIFNTVSTAVLERKQEIGNLRANGESSKDILTLLTIEGLTLGVLGALLGILGGYFIVYVIIPNGILMPAAPGLTRQFYVKVELQTARILLSFVLGLVCAIIASFLAGLRIAKMPIGEALRST
jgi:putative ABC transport system permease protein